MIFLLLISCSSDDAVDIFTDAASDAADAYQEQQFQEQIKALTERRDTLSLAVVSLDGQQTQLRERIAELQAQHDELSDTNSCPCR